MPLAGVALSQRPEHQKVRAIVPCVPQQGLVRSADQDIRRKVCFAGGQAAGEFVERHGGFGRPGAVHRLRPVDGHGQINRVCEEEAGVEAFRDRDGGHGPHRGGAGEIGGSGDFHRLINQAAGVPTGALSGGSGKAVDS